MEAAAAAPPCNSAVIGVVTEAFVKLTVESNASSGHFSERKFNKNVAVAQLKGRLELVTGVLTANMDLEVYDGETGKKLVCRIDDDEKPLGFYPVDSGMRLLVLDRNRARCGGGGVKQPLGEFEDTSKVPKFQLTKEQYSNRVNTVRAFLERNKLGQYNQQEVAKVQDKAAAAAEEEAAAAAAIVVGDRCQVEVPGHGLRRATVRYVGQTSFKPGYWIGVQYDEPLGKNDGAVGGERYFECPSKYGGFVKPMYVKVGNYPEEDLEVDEM